MPEQTPTGDGKESKGAAPPAAPVRLTETQRQILEVLCRPRVGGNRYATPSTNQEIASEVFLSVDAVKAHLRVLYRKFGVDPLPHNQKRAKLVELVMEGPYGVSGGEEGEAGAAVGPAQPQAAAGTEAPVGPPPPPGPAAPSGSPGSPGVAKLPGSPGPAGVAKQPGSTGPSEETAPPESPAPPGANAPSRAPSKTAAPSGPAGPSEAPSRAASSSELPVRPPGPARRTLLIGAGAALGLLVAVLIATGVFSGNSSGGNPESTISRDEFSAAMRANCRLALRGEQQPAGATVSEQARSYLGVIEIVSGRLESLSPPSDDPSLERFGVGLRRAADLNALVAQQPPAPGSPAGDRVVAGLTLAAGQVQAGALGYGLGESCSAVGSLIGRSARNAAGQG
ncbi:MAG: hypothetical protein U0R52_06820 [Solirubrobacterales bacterium]